MAGWIRRPASMGSKRSGNSERIRTKRKISEGGKSRAISQNHVGSVASIPQRTKPDRFTQPAFQSSQRGNRRGVFFLEYGPGSLRREEGTASRRDEPLRTSRGR